MLNLYYTNPEKPLGVQTDPRLSVGGFISSSPVPNDFLNNLFSEITSLTIDTNSRETKAIALKNETGGAITDVTLHLNMPVDTLVKIEVAAVAFGLDSCNDLFMESIVSTRALPINATFVEVNGIANSINIGPMPVDGYIGIWFKRTLLTTTADGKTCQEVFDEFDTGTALETSETVEMVLNWDDGDSISESLLV